MNNEHETSYTLLVRSEERGRSLAETLIYALLGLCAVISIWQFAKQDPYAISRVSRHQLVAGSRPEILTSFPKAEPSHTTGPSPVAAAKRPSLATEIQR